ncbi:unnamed protein product [Prorocentrum cordatum]|uniref:Uncharacterized protein n=1 Tax=Prorocentrum cordatum TaxID=2364126 RepID=A0ABN9YB34_9DINO|nr:unnamed protein product [Polarella glacialis]
MVWEELRCGLKGQLVSGNFECFAEDSRSFAHGACLHEFARRHNVVLCGCLPPGAQRRWGGVKDGAPKLCFAVLPDLRGSAEQRSGELSVASLAASEVGVPEQQLRGSAGLPGAGGARGGVGQGVEAEIPAVAVGFLYALSEFLLAGRIDVDVADIVSVGKDVDNSMRLRAPRPSDWKDAAVWCAELEAHLKASDYSVYVAAAQAAPQASRLAVNPHLLCVASFVELSCGTGRHAGSQQPRVLRYRLELRGINQALGSANTEALARDDRVSKELATAFRQVLISAKDVFLTGGYKRNPRHEGHNLNVAFGSLTVFATFNSADNYAPLLLRPCNGEEVIGDVTCDLSAEQPDVPSLHRMQQFIAESPRAQVQFFKLMDDIADIYLAGIDGSFIGRSKIRQCCTACWKSSSRP